MQKHPSRRKFLGAVAAIPALRLAAELRGGPLSRAAATDADEIRRQFPALRRQVNGRQLIYLDSAATTHKPNAVIDALSEFYRSANANPAPALHTLARRANELFEGARAAVARFLHANSPAEIVWTRGTTEAINLVASSWGQANLKQDDEIVLTISEHFSNLVPWQMVARRTGATIRFLDIHANGALRVDQLDSLLSPRTRLVAFSNISNVLGIINPAKEICTRARRAGARVLIDGAQSVPHIPIDVQDLGCDFFAFSGHKVLGPMGIGVLWAREELLEEMPAYQTGSNMARHVNLENAELAHGCWKFGAGTPNVSGAIGLASALEFLDSMDRKKLWAVETKMAGYAAERLSAIPGLRLLSEAPASERIPLFSFVLSGHTVPQIVAALDERGIAIRGGELAAQPLLERLGVTEAARASLFFYNVKHEVDALADALSTLAQS